jgi:hypothetical protein
MLVRALIAAGVVLVLTTVRGGALEAQTPEPGSSTATATATAGISPQTTPIAATVTPQPVTPLPESGQPTALVGYVIEDTDGNGVRSAGDRGAHTLVEMHQLTAGKAIGVAGLSLFTDQAGRFEFFDLAPGEYLLCVWWPGFISLQRLSPSAATEANPNLLLLGITLGQDGTKQFKYVTLQPDGENGENAIVKDRQPTAATRFEDLAILANPQPQGAITWPLRTGVAQGTIPVGRVSLGAVVLPPSGSGGGNGGWLFPWAVVAVGLAVFAAATAALRVGRRRTDEE